MSPPETPFSFSALPCLPGWSLMTLPYTSSNWRSNQTRTPVFPHHKLTNLPIRWKTCLYSQQRRPLSLGPASPFLPHLLKDFVAEKSPLSPALSVSLLILISIHDAVVPLIPPSPGRVSSTFHKESSQVEVPSPDPKPQPWLAHPFHSKTQRLRLDSQSSLCLTDYPPHT